MDNIKESIAVLPAPLSQTDEEQKAPLSKATLMVEEGKLNQRLFDIGLADKPIRKSLERLCTHRH
jgi:hypothetical protein